MNFVEYAYRCYTVNTLRCKAAPAMFKRQVSSAGTVPLEQLDSHDARLYERSYSSKLCVGGEQCHKTLWNQVRETGCSAVKYQKPCACGAALLPNPPASDNHHCQIDNINIDKHMSNILGQVVRNHFGSNRKLDLLSSFSWQNLPSVTIESQHKEA